MNKYFRKALSIALASAMMVSSAPGLTLAEETPKTEAVTETAKKEDSVQTEAKQTDAPKETAAPETAQKNEAPAEKEAAAPKTEETAAPAQKPETPALAPRKAPAAPAPGDGSTAADPGNDGQSGSTDNGTGNTGSTAGTSTDGTSATGTDTGSTTDAGSGNQTGTNPDTQPGNPTAPADPAKEAVMISWTVDAGVTDDGTGKKGTAVWDGTTDWASKVSAVAKDSAGKQVDNVLTVNRPSGIVVSKNGYKITAALTADAQSKYTADASTYTLIVDPITITDIKWYDNGKETTFAKAAYDGTAHTITAKGYYGVGRTEVALKVNNATEAKATDAGDYKFTASAPDTNYVLDAKLTGAKNNEASLSIAKADSQIQWKNVDASTYGEKRQAPAATYSKYDEQGKAVSGAEVPAANIAVYDEKGNKVTDFTKVDAGTYTVKVEGLDNYSWTESNFTVKKKDISKLTITQVPVPAKTYDGNAADLPTATSSDVLKADEADAFFTPSVTDKEGKNIAADAVKNAGTYTVSFSLNPDVATTKNYTLSATDTAKITIDPATITDITVAKELTYI